MSARTLKKMKAQIEKARLRDLETTVVRGLYSLEAEIPSGATVVFRFNPSVQFRVQRIATAQEEIDDLWVTKFQIANRDELRQPIPLREFAEYGREWLFSTATITEIFLIHLKNLGPKVVAWRGILSGIAVVASEPHIPRDGRYVLHLGAIGAEPVTTHCGADPSPLGGFCGGRAGDCTCSCTECQRIR